jgi:hypothetical protein
MASYHQLRDEVSILPNAGSSGGRGTRAEPWCLKLSTFALSVGLPGWPKSSVMPFAYAR